MLDCFAPAATHAALPIDMVSTARFEDWRQGLDDVARTWITASGFKGQKGRMVMIPDAAGNRVRVAFGLGRADEPFRVGDLPGLLGEGTYRLDFGADSFTPHLMMLGWALGSYRFRTYKSSAGKQRDGEPTARLCVLEGADLDSVERMSEGVYLARDLVNIPANDMGPDELERAARDLAGEHGASVEVTTGEDLLKQNFPLIHAVGAASARAPRLIDMVWTPKGAPGDLPKLTLVGKGVCFDTGGLNIKPGAGMDIMKKDMGGAANVLGLAHMIMGLNMPVRLRVLIPAVENAISGEAFRPGDIFRSRKGITVEIGNTDAEGRLVLADAIALGDEEAPDQMIVMATLTGAARIALGPDLVPFYTDDETLSAQLASAAQDQNDPVWRMPLYRPYTSIIDSRVADINNAGTSRLAGSLTAALFLNKFTAKAKSWMHLDIYAWNPSSRPGRPHGGEAQAIRAIYQVMRDKFAGRDAGKSVSKSKGSAPTV